MKQVYIFSDLGSLKLAKPSYSFFVTLIFCQMVDRTKKSEDKK